VCEITLNPFLPPLAPPTKGRIKGMEIDNPPTPLIRGDYFVAFWVPQP